MTTHEFRAGGHGAESWTGADGSLGDCLCGGGNGSCGCLSLKMYLPLGTAQRCVSSSSCADGVGAGGGEDSFCAYSQDILVLLLSGREDLEERRPSLMVSGRGEWEERRLSSVAWGRGDLDFVCREDFSGRGDAEERRLSVSAGRGELEERGPPSDSGCKDSIFFCEIGAGL